MYKLCKIIMNSYEWFIFLKVYIFVNTIKAEGH